MDEVIHTSKRRRIEEGFSEVKDPQLSSYLDSEPVDRKTNPNPLATWQKLKHGLENVYNLAMEFLPIPATSTASERLFSHAGQIACQLRSRTLPENVDQRLFLKSMPKKYWFSNYQNVVYNM